ncbi:hypothetical protein CPB84DRAFT_1767402 [Gymnopilus junonius]|uniref:Alpha-galactosidase A n=1 Tax=Gymnopilus junonius TaxID=109634 RepID=A0A9P5NTL5_GYMJU|nr:hypothetical protein CPB84DRAFT_1767402 [Gymnopilus junonius]
MAQHVSVASSVLGKGAQSTGVSTEVLSMYVDVTNDGQESEYRILFGDQVKYIVVNAGTYDMDTLTFPPALLERLPKLPKDGWTTARIFNSSESLSFEVSYKGLAEVLNVWHPNKVDVLSFTPEERFTERVLGVTYCSKPGIIKFARFEDEIPRMERETTVYEAIDGQGIGPTFLGHLTENDRVIGLLVQRVEGRRANIDDLEACQAIVKRLHSLGVVHGDLNRHNFIVSANSVTLIDFENATINGSTREMEEEYELITRQLVEETGRGGEEVILSDSEF